MRTLLWFRGKDLRVHDHAALHAAVADCRELVPVFVLAPGYFSRPPRREAPHRLQYLLAAVHELADALQTRGSRLLVVHGPAGRVIPELAARLQVNRVVALASCEPACRVRDERIRGALRVPFETFPGETLIEPASLATRSGGVYRVYTPFARAALEQMARRPLATRRVPRRLPPLPAAVAAEDPVALPTLESLGIMPNPRLLPAGEAAARARLSAFVAGGLERYPSDRDRLDLAGTSRLSADLHFGTLSVGSVWSALERSTAGESAIERYRSELLWREFAHYTLWHQPSVLSEPFRPEFVSFPWRDLQAARARDDDDSAAQDFEAWWQGRTGYPVVDAAARQLLQEGFVHNRARMISASFLTKHLLISYQHGEAHYLRYLTDGDLAQNNMGWQWSAGSGCDAQPYFRVFNPVAQGERFDPDGAYVREYVPELARLPARHIHAPWLAPSSVLESAGVRLGQDYPRPIVDHDAGRKRFLLVAEAHLKA